MAPSAGQPRRGRGGTVARQLLVLQVLVVVMVVVCAVTLAYVDARRSQLQDARDRVLAVAASVADTPQVRDAATGPDPSAAVQPFAEQVRRDSGTDFVVVMGLDRTRWSHPDPAQIGRKFIGDLGGAPAGRPFTQQYAGTLGPSMRAVVPVRARNGEVVALVSVGITLDRLQGALTDRLPSIGLAALLVLALGLTGTWLIARRLKRQTHGLGEREITRMYEYYDAVLHAVREGLLLVDTQERVALVNDEAARLLGLGADVVGRRVEDLGLPASLTRAMLATDPGPDEIHVLDDVVLVLTTAPARWAGRAVGSVVTLRDHTAIQAVAGELDTVRGLAESLRSQNHEATNRLHTVVSLVELGRVEEALDFATEELALAQLLADRVVGSVSDPVVAALLLGKTAQAAERGVQLRLGEDTFVDGLPVEGRDAVTLLGNLVDNAIDAVGDRDVRVVVVELRASSTRLRLSVADSGPGVPAELVAQVFERGWSTKASLTSGRTTFPITGSATGDPTGDPTGDSTGDSTGATPDGPTGRGLGLALVAQTARRHGGRVQVGPSELGGARFEVIIG